MGQILVRNIDDALIQRIEARALVEGRTVEDVVRAVIAAAVPEPSFEERRQEAIRRMDEIRARSVPGPALDWDEIRDERDARPFVPGLDVDR